MKADKGTSLHQVAHRYHKSVPGAGVGQVVYLFLSGELQQCIFAN